MDGRRPGIGQVYVLGTIGKEPAYRLLNRPSARYQPTSGELLDRFEAACEVVQKCFDIISEVVQRCF